MDLDRVVRVVREACVGMAEGARKEVVQAVVKEVFPQVKVTFVGAGDVRITGALS